MGLKTKGNPRETDPIRVTSRTKNKLEAHYCAPDKTGGKRREEKEKEKGSWWCFHYYRYCWDKQSGEIVCHLFHLLVMNDPDIWFSSHI